MIQKFINHIKKISTPKIFEGEVIQVLPSYNEFSGQWYFVKIISNDGSIHSYKTSSPNNVPILNSKIKCKIYFNGLITAWVD